MSAAIVSRVKTFIVVSAIESITAESNQTITFTCAICVCTVSISMTVMKIGCEVNITFINIDAKVDCICTNAEFMIFIDT